MMGKAQPPGMAVAVVYKGKQVYGKGFGVRKVGEPATVDADTVFQLASVSKSVGATVVAHEVGAKTVAWDAPAAQNLPTFKVADPYASSHATVGDLYAHRSGLPDHAGDLLEDIGYSREQILDRLALLSLDSFRASYHYTNFGLTAAAESVARAAGTDWATLSERAIYAPLGMTSTSSRFAEYAGRANRAWTHTKVNGSWQAAVVRDADAQSPAGGVSSSVNDLAKWMAMVLSSGKDAQGQQLVTPEALVPAITPQAVANPVAQAGARTGFYGYGFNNGVQPSAMTSVAHSGAFNAGAGTNFVMLPALDIGIVTLTNGSPFGAAEALNQEFLDLVQYGRATFDWWNLYRTALEGIAKPTGKYVGQTPPPSPTPAGSNAAYTGTYRNAYFGDVQVVEENGGLALRIGPKNLTWPLKHWDKDVFVFEPTGEMANPGTVSGATFTRNTAAATSIDIEYYDETGYGSFTRG